MRLDFHVVHVHEGIPSQIPLPGRTARGPRPGSGGPRLGGRPSVNLEKRKAENFFLIRGSTFSWTICTQALSM